MARLYIMMARLYIVVLIRVLVLSEPYWVINQFIFNNQTAFL